MICDDIIMFMKQTFLSIIDYMLLDSKRTKIALH